ncbi:MAG TPA: glutathione-dependent disulfide-bond oxidoreductase [Novosphingobium sp.]|nr:glutathione-dependent disulfide-bond oxidoreductase [Novosphingobium sp.]
MAESDYVPPKVWVWDQSKEGNFAGLNRPTAGAREEKALARGEHPFQLYSMGTPNGQKVTILFEELLAAGHGDAEYDAWFISMSDAEQFGSGFVAINPNSKIPAMLDVSGPEPVRVFESGAILLHLAEKFGAFIPADPAGRAECLSWLMWQMSTAPFLGGGFGHFYAYAPVKLEYAIDRYAMETKRIFDVADRRLGEVRWLAGDSYTIADIATFCWLRNFVTGEAYEDPREFLDIPSYRNVARWVGEIDARVPVQRGRLVNRRGEGYTLERHAAADIDAVIGT